jgi:hypothetical protein
MTALQGARGRRRVRWLGLWTFERCDDNASAGSGADEIRERERGLGTEGGTENFRT